MNSSDTMAPDLTDPQSVEINRRFYYLIDPQRFQVSERAYHALIEDLPYRLYYTPRSKLLVSIEPLAAPVSRQRGR